MEYPYGSSHPPQRHHRRDDDDRENDYPPPPFHQQPPPPYYENDQHFPPPPPQVTHVYHNSHLGGQAPPPPGHFPPPQQQSHEYNQYPPPPAHGFDNYSQPAPPQNNYSDYPASLHGPQTGVQHVSHESESDHHSYRPHMPSFGHHHSNQQGSEIPSSKPPVRIYSKAKTDFSLTIRNGKVILAPSDPSDPHQHWIKDEKYSTKVKDEQGYPSFILINKATGEAIKHSIGASHPVQLIPYKPDALDESVLWTMSKDLGDGYRTIRMVNNIQLNMDAWNGDENHGGVHDGTTIALWEWKKGDNQRWNLVPY